MRVWFFNFPGDSCSSSPEHLRLPKVISLPLMVLDETDDDCVEFASFTPLLCAIDAELAADFAGLYRWGGHS